VEEPVDTSGPVDVTGQAPKASGGFPSVIIMEPRGGEPFPVPTESVLMDQYGIQFHPKILLARVGQPVEFHNSEDELHNVHVMDTQTGKTLFNVATPVVGSYLYTFDEPGAYDVACHTHPAMAAFIVVTQTPYAVVADKDGTFSLEGVPRGTYDVRVWNVDPARRSERVIEIGETPTALVLDPTLP